MKESSTERLRLEYQRLVEVDVKTIVMCKTVRIVGPADVDYTMFLFGFCCCPLAESACWWRRRRWRARERRRYRRCPGVAVGRHPRSCTWQYPECRVVPPVHEASGHVSEDKNSSWKVSS